MFILFFRARRNRTATTPTPRVRTTTIRWPVFEIIYESDIIKQEKGETNMVPEADFLVHLWRDKLSRNAVRTFAKYASLAALMNYIFYLFFSAWQLGQ